MFNTSKNMESKQNKEISWRILKFPFFFFFHKFYSKRNFNRFEKRSRCKRREGVRGCWSTWTLVQLLNDTRLRNRGWPPSACASADRISASTTSFGRLWRRYTGGPLRKSMYGLLLIYLSVESRVKRKLERYNRGFYGICPPNIKY